MTSQQLNKKDLDNLIFDILHKSKSFDIFPTPVDRIVQYCELNLDEQSNFHEIPKNYIAKNTDAFFRMMKKVFGVFDRAEKSIFIDPELPDNKKRFLKLHETGHGTIPWQKEIHYLDNELTLSPEVKEMFEVEANYFASGGLFQLERYDDEMLKLPLEIGSPMALAKKFGSSKHASFRYYSERCRKRCALLVLENKDKSKTPLELHLRNSFQSKSFTNEFDLLQWPEVFDESFPFIRDYARRRQLHKDGEITLMTAAGFQEFSYHYFHNHYNVFVLIIPKGEKIKSRTTLYYPEVNNRK